MTSSFIYLFHVFFSDMTNTYIAHGITNIELHYIVCAVLTMIFATAFGLIWMFPVKYVVNLTNFYTKQAISKCGA
jgi:hypothetical protein